MKNLKKILFILVAAFMVFGVVYAETNHKGEVPYRQKTAVKRQVDGWNTKTTDALMVGEYFLGVGVDCPQANPTGLSQNYCTSFLSIYDDNQNVVKGTDFSVENGSYFVYAVEKTKTGYVLLVSKEVDAEGAETVASTSIVVIDEDLKVVKEKVLDDLIIETDELHDLVSYENKVLVYFGSYVIFYDVESNTATTLIDDALGAGMTMDKNYIYVATIENTNVVLHRYGYDLKKVDTTRIYTRDSSSGTDLGIVLDLEIIDESIVMSLYGNMTQINGKTEPATENLLAICDKDLKNVKHYPIDITITDFVGSRGDIAYIGFKTVEADSNPKAAVKNGNVEFEISDVKSQAAATETVFYRGKYSLSGKAMWRVRFDNSTINSIKGSSDGVVISGVLPEENAGVTIRYEYELFNVETKTDGNGQITANKVTGAEGEMVEFTITPNKGYVLKKVTVTNEFGQEIEFTDNKFTLPSADVVITVEFEKEVVTNPVTGINNPYISLGLIAAMAAGAFIVLKKKKYI